MIKPIKKRKKRVSREVIRRIKSKFGKTSIDLICCKCGANIQVNTTMPDIYTEEVKKKYVCIHCKYGGKNARWKI